MLQNVINDILDTFPITVHIMLNIEQQIEKIVLQENTINEMVQTISHRFILMLNVCRCLLLW